MFEECMVEFQKIDGDREARLIWRSWEKSLVDQDGTQGSAITAFHINRFVICKILSNEKKIDILLTVPEKTKDPRSLLSVWCTRYTAQMVLLKGICGRIASGFIQISKQGQDECRNELLPSVVKPLSFALCVSFIFWGVLRRPRVFNINVVLIEIHRAIIEYVSRTLEYV